MDASESAPRDGTASNRDGTTGGHAGPRDGIDWSRRRWTTIVLERASEGWRATQTGVAVEGRGETAADAAADYCRRIDGDDDD